MAWGTGTSIAHRAMDALMGPRVIKHETVASSASDVPQAPNTNGVGSSTVCADQSKALIDVWFSSSYHLVYEIYIYYINLIVSLIEQFGFKLFSLVLNKFFSFPFEPFGNAFGLKSECRYQSITK